MFLKKFLKSSETTASSVVPPAGVQTMAVTLQNKFAKGINYNMKIVVRGDRNVGKSCLHLRLQGLKFKEEYIPTHQIEVASINWNYKGGQDIIKVEVWDVVDKGRRKNSLETLKTHHHDERLLDAEFVDVYKGTHGVVLVFDITKQWTFSYVEKELPKIPSDIPVLLLANHLDMGHHRTVTFEQVRLLAEFKRCGEVRVAESCMKDGFGLKYVHAFLSLPFLYLQKCSLLAQLHKNEEEVRNTLNQLQDMEASDDLNYPLFKQSLKSRRSNQRSKEHSENPLEEKVQRQAPPAQPFPDLPGLATTRMGIIESSQEIFNVSKTNIDKKIAFQKNTKQNEATTKDVKKDKVNKATILLGHTRMDEYAPEVDDAYRDFLDDDKSQCNKSDHSHQEEDEEEEDKHNPLVAHFHDEFTSSDCEVGWEEDENAVCQPDVKIQVMDEGLNGWQNSTSSGGIDAENEDIVVNGTINGEYNGSEPEDLDRLQQTFLHSVTMGDTTVEVSSASTDDDDGKKKKKKKKKENEENGGEDHKKSKKKIKSDKSKKSKKNKEDERNDLEEFLKDPDNYEAL